MFRVTHCLSAVAAGLIGLAPLAANSAESAAPRADHLVVGKVSDNPKKVHPALTAMGEYLVRAANGAGLKTSSVALTLTSAEMAERLRKGEVDLVSETLFGALIYERDAGAEIALREWKGGVSAYRSLIVARADSGIGDLEALRGKRIAFQDETSTTAFHAPLAVMLKRGLKMRRIEAGGHSPRSARDLRIPAHHPRRHGRAPRPGPGGAQGVARFLGGDEREHGRTRGSQGDVPRDQVRPLRRRGQRRAGSLARLAGAGAEPSGRNSITPRVA